MGEIGKGKGDRDKRGGRREVGRGRKERERESCKVHKLSRYIIAVQNY